MKRTIFSVPWLHFSSKPMPTFHVLQTVSRHACQEKVDRFKDARSKQLIGTL